MNMMKMGKIVCLAALIAGLMAQDIAAQTKSLVNTSKSPHAKLESLDIGDVLWTNGFWAERFAVCKDSMVPHLLRTYMDAKKGHAIQNFEIAAGADTGIHVGPPFQDGDFYKLLEGATSVYAITRDKNLGLMLDTVIAIIAKTQRPDGYINTATEIAERRAGKEKAFQERMNFETYNLGHLMTAACVHYRVTGKKNFLKVAIKATDYLDHFYKTASPELARNAICPSHYMGVVEMYRTTGNPEYLKLAQNLINIRGLAADIGTDDNQDRVPFRQQRKAMGHAVRANYLYAGAADVYAETGEDSLFTALDAIWNDMVYRKMYITGACGALYDGTTPTGVSYKPADIQQTHQAYGRDYELPNMTAHNETCANIGNMLWNWRMLQVTGDAKYADVVELALYNSVLSGISLDGNTFFYTNPLAVSDSLPYTLRWAGGRVPYIKLSNCCPPNVVRTISEVSDYMYSLSDKGLWLNLYSANNVRTHLKDGSEIRLTEQTDYPWNGRIVLTVEKAPQKAFSVFMRIPGWCSHPKLMINGREQSITLTPGTYAELAKSWKAGDKIELELPMEARLEEANPLVEENRGQVAVKRGPMVYCLESPDMATGHKVFDITMPADIRLHAEPKTIGNSTVISLNGKAKAIDNTGWTNKLYRDLSQQETMVEVTLIPYYAWANRGHSEMTVWMPVSR